MRAPPDALDPGLPADPPRGLRARRRALVALGCLAAGFALARALPGVPSLGWSGAACAALAAAGLTRERLAAALLGVAAVCFGGAWFALRVLEPPRDSLAVTLEGAGPAPVRVRGVVLTAPRAAAPDPRAAWFFDEPRAVFELRAEELVPDAGASVRVSGVLRVRTPGEPGVRPGERVEALGLYSPLPPPANPGEPDARLWGAQEGRVGSLRLARGELIRPLPPAGGVAARLDRAWLGARAAARARAEAVLLGPRTGPGADPGRALLAALILGLREPGLEELQPAFTRLGLAHVLAISGFHLAVMAGVAMALVRCVGDVGRVEPAIVGALVLAYLVVVPANTPVVRSGLMVLGVLAAEAAGRRYDRVALLAWIGVALLLWRPMDLWSLGLQLSLGLVAALLWMGRGAHARLWGVPLRTDLPRRRAWWSATGEAVKAGVSASVLCWALATPLVLHHTGMFSPLAVVAGLVVVPPTVVLLWGAYAALIAGVALPGLASALSPGLGWIAAAAAGLVEGLDALPGAWARLPAVSWAWAACATALGVYWFRRGHRRDRWAWGATVVAAAWLAAEVWAGPRLGRQTVLRIDTLSVGDGTCHLLRSGGGAMLWDCGASSPAAGGLTIPRAARALGAWRIPAAVVTHANTDHYSALPEAAPLLGVRRVLLGGAFLDEAAREPGGPDRAFLARLDAAGVEAAVVAAPQTVRLGRAVLEFLSPPPGADWAQVNNHSLVALVRVPTEAGERRVLLTGDIQAEAMRSLLERHARLHAHVLELPHHGSAHDAAYAFVAAVDPRVVLQSTGPGRAGDGRWDHARPGRAWYTTATDGAAWVEIRRDGSIRHGSLR